VKLWIVSLVVLCQGWLVFAGEVNTSQQAYYGHAFYQALSQGLSGDELRKTIHEILVSSHRVVVNDFDRIEPCNTEKSDCYRHHDLGYRYARRVMFGEIFLETNGRNYQIKDVYCETVYSSSDFPKGSGPGPMKIPNPAVMNAEHSWPQSMFSDLFPRGLQKSDLHILYPVSSRINSTRSNFPFGEVIEKKRQTCTAAKMGSAMGAGNSLFFEPPDTIKGDVARSLFYFSVRYKMQVLPVQEDFLRKWNDLDPVSQSELERQETIYRVQGNRNPFVDHPGLIDLVADF
jgi:hypothetical protein